MKVSVIIPTFNGSKYIEEAIKSVLSQTYKDIEIIVVDDGSEDETIKIAKKYPVKIVELGGNFGVARARNEGIKRAEGEYIAFLDQDDLYIPPKIEIFVEEMKDNETEFIYSDLIIYDEVIGYSYIRKYFYSTKRKELLQTLFFDVIGVPLVWLIKKSAFSKIGFFDEDPEIFGSDDWDFMFRIVRKLNIKKINSPTAIYRIHSGNTHKKRDKIRFGWEKVLSRALRDILPSELFDGDYIKGYETLAQKIKTHWWKNHYFYPEKLIEEIRRKIDEEQSRR